MEFIVIKQVNMILVDLDTS